MKRFGLADALGIVAALAAIAWVPALYDSLTPIKLFALAVGGVAVSPAVVARWRAMGRPPWPVLVPSVAVVLILIWGLISIIGSRAPIWDALFGWWGRGDGWLAWLGAAFLLLGAVTLSTREVARTITWLLGGATIAALVGVLQLAGVSIATGVGPVVSLMGHYNFAAGYFAILALLALGRAVIPGPRWQRIWAGALFLCLAVLACATTALQGPAALGTGIVAFIVAYALMYRGPRRRAGLIAASIVVGICGVVLAISVLAPGPLNNLWSDGSFTGRFVHWGVGLRIMAGEPLFGTGPSGFARYVSEYRPESYVEARGPLLRLSAAHDIALQFGAVLGVPGLLMWLTAFFGTATALAVRIVRVPVVSIGLTASVAGAFTAFLVQGMVSIDMLPLLATGWLVAGLALACIRDPANGQGVKEESTTAPIDDSASAATNEDGSRASTPLWVPLTGAFLAVLVGLVVWTQVSLNYRMARGITPEEALSIVTDPMTPCGLRVQIAPELTLAFPPGISSAAILQATEIDRRCLTMVQLAAGIAVRERVLELAATYTADAVRFDPMLDSAWVLRGRYFLGAGDVPSAEAALAEARRLQTLYSVPRQSIAEVQVLDQLIQQVKAQSRGPNP